MFWRRSRHNRSGHHSRPSQPQQDESSGSRRRDGQPHDRRIELVLEDLDAEISGRHASKIGIKKTSQLGHVATFLKKRYAKGNQRITPDARIEFYWDRQRIDRDEIPKGMNTLSYRIYCEGDTGTIRIDWSGSTLSLATGHKEQVESEVLKEGTVSSIRRIIVRLLRESDTKPARLVKNPLQIEICAVGGLRPGALQGSNWVARRATDAWLCRYIRIHVRPDGEYFVFRGFNEEYIWHRPELDRHDCVQVRSLKQWLRHEVLSVALSGQNKIAIHNDDIRLQTQGKFLRDRDRVRVGRTLDFDVTQTVENRFVQVEAWLLEITEMCSVCGDDKRISEMPRKITASCTHPVTMCKECVAQWITSSLDTVAWDRLKCPECPQLLRFEDIRAFASPDIFERYDNLATRAAMGGITEFKWCLNPRCNAGQIYPRSCSKAQCYACKRSVCVHHNVPWHKHETCEQYDHRTRKLRKGEKASAKWIKETTKPCPRCERAVHKYIGCDHVTCICGHEWCWLCLSPHYRDDQGLLQCKHKEDCRYFHHPPDYEGGRAFMPFLNFGGPPPFHRHAHPHQHQHAHAHAHAHAHPHPPPLFPFPPPPPGMDHHRHPLPRPAPRGVDPFRFVFLNEMLGQAAVNHHHHVNFNNGNPAREIRPGPFNFARAAAGFNMEQFMQRAGR